MCVIAGKIAKEITNNFGTYNNMPPRERFIRINDRLDANVETHVVDNIFIAVKETREYLLSKLSEF